MRAMSNEEMVKKMEFIVEHQAKFAAEIEIMREVQTEQYNRLSNALIGVVDIVGNLTRAQMRTDEKVGSLEESFTRLAQAQTRTEESLKVLINVVERHIHGNGGAESPA